jgi:hypothetical protein
MTLDRARTMITGEGHSRVKERGPDTGPPVAAVDGEARNPPGARILRQHPGQGPVGPQPGKGTTRANSGPTHRMVTDVSDQTRRIRRIDDLLAQRLAVIRFWARRQGRVSARAEEGPTPAPRRILPASPEHGDEVIPSIGGRRPHLYEHGPSLQRPAAVQRQTRLPSGSARPASKTRWLLSPSTGQVCHEERAGEFSSSPIIERRRLL